MSEIRIREANSEDVEGMARVRVDTWRATYRGIVPDEYLHSLSYEEVSGRWQKAFLENRDLNVGIFVAENDQKEIVGIAVCGPEQNSDPFYNGEIYILYVLPAHQNRGIGRRLVAACVNHLQKQLQSQTMLIWVIAENPYRRFYESLGGKKVREKYQEIGGRKILEAGYGWEVIQQLSILPEGVRKQ